MDKKEMGWSTDEVERVTEEQGMEKWSVEYVEQYTQNEAELEAKECEKVLYSKLMPEYNLQIAIREEQKRQQEKIRADVDIKNKASEFIYRIKGAEFEKALDCFALKTAGVSLEVSRYGVYDGPDKMREYVVDYLSGLVGVEGTFQYINLLSPVVEVAEDMQTGKGMWLTLNMETWKRDDLKEGYTDPVAIWSTGPWCMDFIKEDGVWKIWHLTIYEDVTTVFEESWTEISDHRIPDDPAAPKPSRPSSYHNPFTTEREPVLFAEPPVPYATYEGAED